MDFNQERISFDPPNAQISFDNRASGVIETESNKHIDQMRQEMMALMDEDRADKQSNL